MPRLRIYNISFLVIFSLFWFLFKIGGFANIEKAWWSTVVDMTVSIVAMLITVQMLLPKLFYTRRYGSFLGSFLLLILLAGSSIILLQLQLAGSSLASYDEKVARSNHYFYWFWSDLIFGSYFLVFMIAAAGAAIRFAFDRLIQQSRVEQLEKEKLQAELDRLKNQINPHFLFNALNTIFYKIDRINQPARETLQLFSGMLRYQLYECEKSVIEIEKELRFLSSYIDLQKERMNDHFHITCKGLDEVKGLFITPFLLMPLIENCFKHVSQWTDRTNEINIECRQENNTFVLITSNSSHIANDRIPGGIGLQNIRKRLELVYPGMHQLITKQSKERFELTLQLELT